jgi:hypothetical protein
VSSAGNRREHGLFVGGETPVTGRFRRIVLFSIARSQRTARNGERDAGWRLRAPLHYTTIHTLVCGCRLRHLTVEAAECPPPCARWDGDARRSCADAKAQRVGRSRGLVDHESGRCDLFRVRLVYGRGQPRVHR